MGLDGTGLGKELYMDDPREYRDRLHRHYLLAYFTYFGIVDIIRNSRGWVLQEFYAIIKQQHFMIFCLLCQLV